MSSRVEYTKAKKRKVEWCKVKTGKDSAKKRGARKLRFSELLFPDNRPNCPRCGSEHVISRGIEWGCANCGRRWIKTKTNWGKTYEKEEMDREADQGED